MGRAYCFYDGECPLCRGTIDRFGWSMRQFGVRPVPLQGSPLDQPGLRTWLLADMKVWTGRRLVGGARAMIWLIERSWLGLPLAWILRLPPLSAGADVLYKRIAASRHCSGGACAIT